MPGKQLSIDSDLRAGLIDRDEARNRRKNLELESKLYGSLDGAMKFVKGDAIAGIVIIIVNLIGGLAVGMAQLHLGLAEAVQTYSVLTIGDGMVTQVPALLCAMSAGLVVTRTTDESRDSDLAQAVRRQIAERPRALLIVGLLCCLLALIPGLPSPVFAILGLSGVGLGVGLNPTARGHVASWLYRKGIHRPSPRPLSLEAARAPAAEHRLIEPLVLELNGPSAGGVDGAALVQALSRLGQGIEAELGMPLPAAKIQLGLLDADPTWRLTAFEVELGRGPWRADGLADLEIAVGKLLRQNLGDFLGMQEAATLVNRCAITHPDVVKEVNKALPLARIAEVMRRLVEEGVTLRNMPLLLETLADIGQKEKEGPALAMAARLALRRSIVQPYEQQGVLRTLTLSPSLEAQLREALKTTPNGPQLALSPVAAKALIDVLRLSRQRLGPLVLLTPLDLRRSLRKLIEPDVFDLPVVAFQELHPATQLEVVETIQPPGLPAPPAPRPSGPGGPP